MELIVLDSSFNQIAFIETFESMIWTDRYSGFGDFEITTYANSEILSNIQIARYLWQKDSEHIMIVEDVWVHTNQEAGNTVIIKGRSLESILDRRIVWNQTILDGTVQESIYNLLSANIINAADTNRQIPNFVFQTNTDPALAELSMKAQYTGDNLYTVISDICTSFSVGFKIVLSSTNQFVFSLYLGQDRSYDQIANPYVVFSDKFENIVNSDYKESNATQKTVILTAGEGEGSDRISVEVVESNDGLSGLNRREMFINASDISRTTDEGQLAMEDYLLLLARRGSEELSKYPFSKTFEGEVNPNEMFVFGTDFFLGDIVQVADEYGHEAKSRVVEIIYSQDSNGIRTYPTFKII